jgi:hypothetical protein
LRPTAERNSAIQGIDEVISTVLQPLLAEHLRQEQHGESVPIGVPLIVVRVSDQSILAGLPEQVIGGSAQLLGVRALGDRRSAAQ